MAYELMRVRKIPKMVLVCVYMIIWNMTLARRISDRYNNKFSFLFPVSGSGSELSVFMWQFQLLRIDERDERGQRARLTNTVIAWKSVVLYCVGNRLCCHIAVIATPSRNVRNVVTLRMLCVDSWLCLCSVCKSKVESTAHTAQSTSTDIDDVHIA